MTGLLAPPLLQFGLAALVLVALVAVEAVSLAVGHSLSGGLDHFMPVEALHADGGHELGSPSTWLSWINVGRVPVLILVMIALAAFAAKRPSETSCHGLRARWVTGVHRRRPRGTRHHWNGCGACAYLTISTT